MAPHRSGPLMATLAPPPLNAGHLDGVVFDLDGTLVDSYRAIAFGANAARARFGLPPMAVDDVRSRVGHGLERLMRDLLGDERVAEGVEAFREAYGRVFLDDTFAAPHACEVLAALHERGFRLSVASNKPARFCRPILNRLGMLDFLATVESPDTSGATKPDPAMLRRCLQAMGVTADRAAYVGDMPLDVETAARAGVSVILTPGGSAAEDSLRATGQTVVPSLAALVELLSGTREGGRR